jgi:predicted MFS family arabinose efflux permease
MSDRSESLAAAPDRARSPAAVAAAGLVALAVAMGVGRFAFTPILPLMQEDAGLSVAAGGWLASANYAGYLAGALSAIGFQLRAATAIRGGLVAIGLTTLGMGLDAGFAVWVVLRALAGVASAWVLVSVSAWCLERLAALRAPMLGGTVFAGVGTGIAAAGALCLALMHVSASSAQAWIALGILSLAFAAVVWPILGDGATSATPARPGERGLRWGGESVRLVLCYGAFGFGYIIPATFLPVMAKQVVQDPAVFGWAWPVFGVAAAVSTLAAAALPKLVANRHLWILGHLVMAFGVALPVFWPGVVGIMLAALLVGGTFMVITMAGMQEARRIAGEHGRALMAAMTAAFALGQIAGPLSVSFVVGADGGFSAALLVAALLLAASASALAFPGATALRPQSRCRL